MLGLSTTPTAKNLREANDHTETRFREFYHLINRKHSNHLFLCDGKRAKVQGELGEVAGVLPGQMDRQVVRISVKLGRPHHNLKISSFKSDPKPVDPTHLLSDVLPGGDGVPNVTRAIALQPDHLLRPHRVP